MKKLISLTIAVLTCMISFNLLAECTGISFDPAMSFGEAYDDYGNVTGYYPSNLESYDLSGFTSEDQAGILSFEFYPEDLENGKWTEAAAVGTYNLGAGNNTNYSSCNQCVRMYHFVHNPDAASEDEEWNNDKQFFQQEGTLQILHTDFVANDHYYYHGLLSVKLAEATVDTSTWVSSFVEGGDCYEIESGAWTTYPEGTEPTDDTTTDPTTEPTTDPTTEPTTDPTTEPTTEPTDNSDTEVPADTDETPADDSSTPADEEDDGGCALVTI